MVKRLLEVVAAGGHNVMLNYGSTLNRSSTHVRPARLLCTPCGRRQDAARALPPSILPRMTPSEALDVTRSYSVSGTLPDAGTLPGDVPLIRHRPFRAPSPGGDRRHHTISHAGLVGGGQWPRPGEISG